MLKLNVRSSASADLTEALAYYAAASPALPEAFLEQLDIALTLLRERPHIWAGKRCRENVLHPDRLFNPAKP